MSIPEGRLPWGETYAENIARGLTESKVATLPPHTFIGDVLVWDELRDALYRRGFIGQRANGSWTWTAEGHRWLVSQAAGLLGLTVPRPWRWP